MREKDNRWWEYYVARYLAGNIFAVLVLFYLVMFKGNEIQKSLCQDKLLIPPTIENSIPAYDAPYIDLCKDNNLPYTIFDFLFHTSKDISLNKEGADKSLVMLASEESGFISTNSSKIEITEINFANIFVVGVISFLYMYILSIPIYFLHITRGALYNITTSDNLVTNIYSFIKDSTSTRHGLNDQKNQEDQEDQNHPKPAKSESFNKDHIFTDEYVTTYQHMREHGNAFGIILMEIIFAFLLIQTDFSVLFIIAWLNIGFSGWFLGIYLEYKMIAK